MAELRTSLLIGGETVAGEGAPLDVENPFSEETIATLDSASPEQIDAAVAAARGGFEAWGVTPATERADMLHEVATRLRGRTLALLEVGGRAEPARGRRGARGQSLPLHGLCFHPRSGGKGRFG